MEHNGIKQNEKEQNGMNWNKLDHWNKMGPNGTKWHKMDKMEQNGT